MNAIGNKLFRRKLSSFKGKNLPPKGYFVNFHRGESLEDRFSDNGIFLGKAKVFSMPCYDVINRETNETAFSIEAGSGQGRDYVQVVGQANCAIVENWEDAISLGLEYEKIGA